MDSESESVCKGLKTVVEEVTKDAEKLQKINKGNQRLCEEYKGYFKSETSIEKDLQKIQEDLDKLKLKASTGKVVIEFVGAQSSGKSTLINALLRDDRLPAGYGATTMCLTEIHLTDDEHWIVKVDDKLVLSNTREKKEIKNLLTAITNEKQKKEREQLGINEDSLVRVFWPKDKDKERILPENVVLVDSPGYGEDKMRNDQVKKSGQKTDILVAVMDPDRPSFDNVEKVVAKVDCKYVFGVFTHWDEAVEEAPCLESLKTDVLERFLLKVNARASKSDVFFVDSKHVVKKPTEHKDSSEVKAFYKFEERLASSGEKWKQESLKEEATRVVETAERTYGNFKDVMQERNEEKLRLLGKKLELLEDGEGNLRKICEDLKTEICEDLDTAFREMEDRDIDTFRKELNGDGKTTEEQASQTLSETLTNKTKQLMVSNSEKINDKLKKWDEVMEEVEFFEESRAESKTFRFECKALPRDKYNCYKDPAFYIRNRFVTGILCAGVLGVLGKFVVSASLAKLATTLTTGAFTSGGLSLGYAFGKVIEKPKISGRKLDSWEDFLKELLKELRENVKNYFLKEIDKMLQKKLTVLSNEKTKIKSDRQEQTKITEGWFEELNRRLREVKDIRQKIEIQKRL